MKKILFLFIVLASISKAQNDSITFFAYTDNNNNCLYEPGMGEVSLNHFSFDFSYKFNTGNIQNNIKTTNNNGFIVFYSPSAFAPASNTITVAQCYLSAGALPQLSSCFISQNLAYNTTYSVGVYSPVGIGAFNCCNIGGFQIYADSYTTDLYTPGYKFFCIGKSSFNPSGPAFNYIGNNIVTSSFTLSFQGGSSSTQVFTSYVNYNSFGCATISGSTNSVFTNPELSIPGVYTVTIIAPGTNAPTYSNTFILAVDSCESIIGRVYVDCNSNCFKDVNEYNCDEEVIVSTNGTYTTTIIPDYNGNYNIVTPYSTIQYSATITPNLNFSLACSTPSFVTYLANTNSTNFFNNTLTQTVVNNINYFSYLEHPYSGSSIPGGNFKFKSFYDVIKPDYCSMANNSGVYYVKLDQNTQLISVDVGSLNYSNLYTTASGDSIVWTLSDLRTQTMNMGGHNFVLNLSMKTTAIVGLPYTITSGIISNVVETNLSDNVIVGTWLIGGPFDPNYIEVSPKGTGAQGYIPLNITELYYTINFQNVGTSPAVNIKVKNVLDNDLDKSSLKIIGSSAPVTTNIDVNGATTFLFNHIMLADSSNDEPNSHGFVTYKINLKPGLVAGTQFTNTASIYFDYNSPVVTNTTINTLQSTSGLQELNQSTFNVYPNPAKFLVSINSNDVIKKISVMNVLGEIVQSIVADSKEVSLNISELKPNVYFLQIITVNNQVYNQKIVKE